MALDDSRLDLVATLAELYIKLDLRNEALAQYQKIAAAYEREHMLPEALDVVKRMLELDPENVAISTKLAELHYKMGHRDEGFVAIHVKYPPPGTAVVFGRPESPSSQIRELRSICARLKLPPSPAYRNTVRSHGP